MRWTKRQIILKKPVKFVALSIVLLIGLLSLIDPVLTKVVRGLGIQGNFLGGVFFFAILFLSVWLAAKILQIIYNARLSMVSEEEARILYEKDSKIRWYKIYGLVIGYIVLLLMFALAKKTLFKIADDGGFLQSLLCSILGLVLPFVIANFASRTLNKKMIEITATNQELIQEILQGKYDDKIPQKFRNRESLVNIIKILENAEATSIKGAILLYSLKRTLGTVGKASGLVAGVMAAGVAVVTMGCMEVMVSEIESQGQAIAEGMRRERMVNDIVDGIMRRL